MPWPARSTPKHRRRSTPHPSFRRAAGRAQAGPREPVHTAARRAAARSQLRNSELEDDARTRALIDHGRRNARRRRFSRVQRVGIGLAVAAVGLTLLIVVVLRPERLLAAECGSGEERDHHGLPESQRPL